MITRLDRGWWATRVVTLVLQHKAIASKTDEVTLRRVRVTVATLSFAVGMAGVLLRYLGEDPR